MGVKLAFRHQRAIFGFVVLGLLILFSTAVLWGHYEKIITNYQWLAKAGLALVDVIAVGLALWHFYAKHTPLKVWCYLAEGAIAVMMIVHAGAVLQLDSSTAQQTHAVQTAADVQVKLIEAQGKANAETETARIKAAGEAAAAVKAQTGSTTLASRTLKNGTTTTAQPQAADTSALVEQASKIKPTTFMSEGYMNGGIYVWPALIAFGLFFVAIGISAFSEPHEDVNQNHVPDDWERMVGRDVQPVNPPQPVTLPASTQAGTIYSYAPDGQLVAVRHGLTDAEARQAAIQHAGNTGGQSALSVDYDENGNRQIGFVPRLLRRPIVRPARRTENPPVETGAPVIEAEGGESHQ